MAIKGRDLLLGTVIWVAMAGTALAEGLSVSGAQWSRLDKGEILVTIGPSQGGIRLYQVMGLLDAAPERVWRMLMDIDHYSEIFTAVSKSYVKKHLSDRHLQHFEELSLPWPLNSRWFVNYVTLKPDELRYDWYNLEGNVKEQRGSFIILPRQSKSLLCYRLRFDPDAPWFPKFLLNIGQQVTLPSVIKDTRKAVVRY